MKAYLVLFVAFFLSGCALLPLGGPRGEVTVVQITDAGDFAITSDRNDRVILWDLENQTSERLTSNGDWYSAAISANGRYIFWQERDRVTHLVDRETGETTSKEVENLVFGAAVSNDGRVLVSDPYWSIWLIEDGAVTQIRGSEYRGYQAGQQILTMEWARDGERFLTSARGGIQDADELPPYQEDQGNVGFNNTTVWSAKTLEPEYVWTGNAAKAHASISLDGAYILSGCENAHGFVLDGPTGEKIQRLGSLRFGIRTNPDGGVGEGEWDDSGLIDPPEGFHEERSRDDILAMRFITEEHFLRINTHKPWVILYHVDDPLPKKYFPLGESPFPAVSEYRRHEASAAAPEGNVFVIGRHRGRGILVYEFDEEAMSFEQVWTPRR